MAFPKPEDYKTHDGPTGSPVEWRATARGLVATEHDKRDRVPEHLATLGLTEKPRQVHVLKAAYRQAVRTAHPDKGGSSEAMHEVQEAYEALLEKIG